MHSHNDNQIVRPREGKQLQNINRVFFILFILQLVICSSAVSASALEDMRFVAIVMDDLGNDLELGEELVSLPFDLTCSFLPHTHHSPELIQLAHKNNKEVMLHLPMQPLNNRNMGPGGLDVSMSHREFIDTFRQDFLAIPGAIGINNHMGSLLTQDSLQMQWLMAELKENNNLYFVDSRTHPASVAADEAKAYRVPTASRDVFLDHVVEKQKIDYQFERLLNRINRVGYALAIGHPHLETLDALKNWLPRLKAEGIKIVTVSRYIALKEARSLLWQASLSRSHKVAKN